MSSYEESNRSRRSYPQASSLAFSRSSTSQSPGELLTQSNMRQAGIPPPGDPVTLQPPPGFPAQVAPSQQTSRGGSTSSVQTAFRRPPAPRPPPPVGLPSRGSAQSSNGHRRLARPRPGPPSNCSSTDTGSQYGFQRSAGQPGAPSGYTPSARSLVSQSPEQVGYSQHGSSLRASQRESRWSLLAITTELLQEARWSRTPRTDRQQPTQSFRESLVPGLRLLG